MYIACLLLREEGLKALVSGLCYLLIVFLLERSEDIEF